MKNNRTESVGQENKQKQFSVGGMKFEDTDCCFSQCTPALGRLWPFQGDPCQVTKTKTDDKVLADEALNDNEGLKCQEKSKTPENHVNVITVREKSEVSN